MVQVKSIRVGSPKKLQIALLGWIFTWTLLSVSAGQACVICIPYPERTLADRLLENSDIAFIREVADSPYLFVPVEILRGLPSSEPIKIFCDSSTRRKLLVIPDSVLVVARAGATDTWQRVTFADTAYQSFIRDIVLNSNDWQGDLKIQNRVNYFSKLLTSEHPYIQEQAYLEVGRAPYQMIKQVAGEIPKAQIYAFLENLRFIEWHNLYILFLGQSTDPKDQAYIRNQVESAVRFGTTTNLASWVTAFIETHPNSGIEEVESWYFAESNHTGEELEQVMASMSVLGSQQNSDDWWVSPLREEIVRSYGALLKNYPELAGNVARDLSIWQVNAHTDQLSAIQEDKTLLDPSSTYLVDYYLSMAKNFTKINLEKDD